MIISRRNFLLSLALLQSGCVQHQITRQEFEYAPLPTQYRMDIFPVDNYQRIEGHVVEIRRTHVDEYKVKETGNYALKGAGALTLGYVGLLCYAEHVWCALLGIFGYGLFSQPDQTDYMKKYSSTEDEKVKVNESIDTAVLDDSQRAVSIIIKKPNGKTDMFVANSDVSGRFAVNMKQVICSDNLKPGEYVVKVYHSLSDNVSPAVVRIPKDSVSAILVTYRKQMQYARLVANRGKKHKNSSWFDFVEYFFYAKDSAELAREISATL